VGVEFTSLITRRETDLSLVDETDSLDIVLGIQPLDTSDSAGGDDARTVAGLGAPSDFTSFTLANSIIRLTAAPHAEVGNVIHESRLAERAGPFGGAVALVVTELRTTNTTLVASDLVGNIGIGEVFRGEGFEGRRRA